MQVKNNQKHIVVIGGGTGVYTVLSALKSKDVELSAVVSMCDDGGSTGRLRDGYGVLPPGDIRRSLIALSGADRQLRKLFEYRFKSGELAGHNFGNIFLATLEKVSGNFYGAVKLASKILNVRGRVVPVTTSNIRLHAELENGTVVSGETNIDIPKHNPDLKIKKVFLKPRAGANPDAIKSVLSADVIIMGPGDLWTSILPNFLVGGIAKAVRKSKARKIFITNLMTKYGETNGYNLSDFVAAVEKFLGPENIDYVLANNTKFAKSRLKKYIKEKSEQLKIPRGFSRKGLVRTGLATDTGLIRHDTKKLARALMKLIH